MIKFHFRKTTKNKYSGTPLIRSPTGQKNWPYYRGRLKFHDLRAVMTNTQYNAFAFLEQLFLLINKWNVDIVYSEKNESGAPNENIVQNHLNIALINVF